MVAARARAIATHRERRAAIGRASRVVQQTPTRSARLVADHAIDVIVRRAARRSAAAERRAATARAARRPAARVVALEDLAGATASARAGVARIARAPGAVAREPPSTRRVARPRSLSAEAAAHAVHGASLALAHARTVPDRAPGAALEADLHPHAAALAGGLSPLAGGALARVAATGHAARTCRALGRSGTARLALRATARARAARAHEARVAAVAIAARIPRSSARTTDPSAADEDPAARLGACAASPSRDAAAAITQHREGIGPGGVEQSVGDHRVIAEASLRAAEEPGARGQDERGEATCEHGAHATRP